MSTPALTAFLYIQSNWGIYCLLLIAGKDLFECKREGSAVERSTAQLIYGSVGLQQCVSAITSVEVSKYATQEKANNI